MKGIIIAVASSAALLSGCSGGESTDADTAVAATPAPPSPAAVAEGAKPRPGLYKTTVTMTGIAFPGMPPEMQGHGAGLARTLQECITPEQAAKGFEDLLKQGQDGECSFDKLDLKDGALDGVMVCRTSEGVKQLTMAGTTTATSVEFTSSTTMSFDEVGEGTMTFAAKHERIGDCPAP